MKLLNHLAKFKPSEWPSRRMALAMLFSGLVVTHGYEEAEARAIRGGIAVAGGGSETTLTPWTVKNNTGSAMTNVPIEIYVPFSAATDPIGGGAGLYPFASTSAIKLYDSDGTTVIPCQEDNRSSDLNSEVRGLKLSAILPSLGANATKQLTVKKITNTSPQSGTDVSASDISAVSYDLVLTMGHKDGNTYTASAATGLAASTTWTNKTTAFNNGKWRGNSNGGYVTEYIVYCPFSRSGGTIFTENNIGAWFCISAFKAQAGAVSGGNPIIGICTKYWIECGWARITPNTARAHWFDLTATSGTNTQSWVGSTPATSLTLSANSIGTTTATAGSVTFNANSVGMVIGDGTGNAKIVGYTSSTVVTVWIGKPLSSTSISSGAWRIYGLSHEYGSVLPQQELWFGGSPAITTKPDIYSHLGTAWSGTAGGPFTYLRDTRMILPFSTPQSSITNSMTNINNQGTNPTALGNGIGADLTMYMPTTGGRDDIAPVLGYHVGALIKFDSNAWRKIFRNAEALTTAQYYWRDDNTGKMVKFDNGTNFVYPAEFGSNALPTTSNYYYGTYSVTDWTPQIAHHPNAFHVPFLLTGDFFWVEKMHQQLFWTWAAVPDGYYGTGFNRGLCLASEQRGNGWNFRDIFIALFMTPDRNPSCLSYTRSHIQSLYDGQFTYTGSGTLGVSPYPGLNMATVNNTGTGKAFATSGDRYIGAVGTSTNTRGGRNSLWQLGYGISAFFLGKCIGMLSTYASDFMTWAMEGVVGYAADSAVNAKWLAPIYYMDLQDENGGAYVNNWAGIYRVSANDLANSGSGLNRRLITGTGISLSAVSGSAVTFTAPTGYFDAGGTAFYTNGLIRDLSACSLRIVPMSATSRAGYDNNAYDVNVGTSSGSSALPTNAGTLKVWNRGSKTIYIKLTVGAGTATTSDTAITAGNYGKFTVGSNTYVNYIAAAGAGTPVATMFGSVGSGYANGNTITVAPDGMGSFTLQTAPVLTVNDVGVNGDVVDVSISNAGRYTTSTVNASRGDTLTQTATSGSGTGFVYRAAALDTGDTSPMRFGTGFITAVNTGTHVVTIDTTTSMTGCQGEVQYGYPFAQTSLVTNMILAPAPYPGDADGAAGGGNSTLPTPYTSGNEYWTIALNCAKLAEACGYTNGATAKTAFAAAYTGSQELKWRVVD